MSKPLYPRMDVLQSLYELTADITPNRFITTRPPATGKQMDEFLLISLDAINDTADTYQLTRGKISVFARDIEGALEDTVVLDRMLNAVCDLFPIRSDLYLATRPKALVSSADSAGFHYIIIQFNIRIHKDFDIHPKELFTL